MQISPSRTPALFSSDYVTLIAIYLGALLYLATLVIEILDYSTIHLANTNSSNVNPNSIALGLVVLFLLFIANLHRSGHKLAVNMAIAGMTLSVPFVFDGHAFIDGSIPNGIWFPFIFALIVSRFQVALITLGVSIILALLSYPGAFQTPNSVAQVTIIFALLVIGKIILSQLQREYLPTTNDEVEKMVGLAYFDQLTGLPNRTLLEDRLNQVISISSRSGVFGALLFIDLDHFKHVNDTYGHHNGDVLLRQVADHLKLRIREGDTAARFGGDEFVVLLTELSVDAELAANKANAVALKLLEALNQTFQLGEVTYRNTASIGVTMFNGRCAHSDELIKQADMAMYKSKKAGKNTLRFFDPTLELAMKHHATMEKELRMALADNQFELHYQAQFTESDTGRRTLTGAEALLRWEYPEKGMLLPAEFIPFAEETGLIVPIDKWVVDAACRQLAVWAKDPATQDLMLSINVSALQFKQTDFVEIVANHIQSTGANPHRLNLEMKESMLIDNVEDTIQKMLALRKLGIRFSLDDFGTGHFSMASLRHIPIDQIKIDPSFINDIHHDTAGAAIAQTIITLGHSLGLSVIAEGVETQEQRQFLAKAGCLTYQGNLFGHPMEIDEFETQLVDDRVLST